MKKTAIILLSLVTLVLLLPDFADAQCAMCKATAEQSDQRGLNTGIFYLFAAPYLMVGTIAFLWWKYRRTEDDENELTRIEPERMN